MRPYDYDQKIKFLWTEACARYKSGVATATDMFSADEKEFISSIGAVPQEFFDFAEDFNKYGEPDFVTCALVLEVRYAYFMREQKGVRSTKTLRTEDLPAKEAQVNGMAWLPRIIPKAKARLRGELPSELMFGCGGDRRFLKERNIHPAEFLTMVWAHENDDAALIKKITGR